MRYEQVVLDHEGEVAVLRFAAGKLNAMSPAFLRDMRAAVHEIGEDSGVRAAIMTGGDSRFFSFGLDVPQLLRLGRGEMTLVLTDLNELLRALFLSPKPLIAAVNGHAMAGGLLMAVTADYRIGAEGTFSFGLSEVNLALSAPGPGLRIMARQIGEARTREIALTGGVYDPEEARRRGLLQEIVAPRELMDRSLERAAELAKLPDQGVSLNKQFLAAGIFHHDPARQKEENKGWLDAWFSDEAQIRLKALAERR
jgi:enoyl-CoA hydratase